MGYLNLPDDGLEAYATPEEMTAVAKALADDEEEKELSKRKGPLLGEVVTQPAEADRDLYVELCAKHEGDSLEALFDFCVMRNVFYYEKVAKQFALSTEDETRNAMPQPYLQALDADPNVAGRDFLSQLDRKSFEEMARADQSTLKLSAEDRKNRQQIMSIVNYDPFAEEPDVDRPQMYRDLAGLLTDAMRRDIPKRNAAIEVVHDYTTIARYQRRLAALETSGLDDNETRKKIDNCITMISKMQDTINKLTKENGFSSGKGIGSSGRGGLSEVMNICEERGYDKAAVNMYDVATSDAMRQVAEISVKAMLNQVNLSGTDYADRVTAQCVKVHEYRDAALKALEGWRLAESKLEKQGLMAELAAELRRKGISEKDILEIVEREIKMVSGEDLP